MSEEQWIKIKGRISVDPKSNRIAVNLGFDFINYYVFFIERAYLASFSYPKHGGHVSIFLPLHGKVDFGKAKKFDKKWVEMEVNPDVITGGKKKGIRNFWMKIRSPEIDAIKKELGIKDGPAFLGSHVTICSEKGGIRKFQRKMIEIVRKAN